MVSIDGVQVEASIVRALSWNNLKPLRNRSLAVPSEWLSSQLLIHQSVILLIEKWQGIWIFAGDLLTGAPVIIAIFSLPVIIALFGSGAHRPQPLPLVAAAAVSFRKTTTVSWALPVSASLSLSLSLSPWPAFTAADDGLLSPLLLPGRKEGCEMWVNARHATRERERGKHKCGRRRDAAAASIRRRHRVED